MSLSESTTWPSNQNMFHKIFTIGSILCLASNRGVPKPKQPTMCFITCVDLDKITDEINCNAVESHIQNFGQTPSQLNLLDPHPPCYPVENCWKPLIYEPSIAGHLRCHMPAKQVANKRSENAKGAVLKLLVLPDSVYAIYTDMSVGTYHWNPHYKSD